MIHARIRRFESDMPRHAVGLTGASQVAAGGSYLYGIYSARRQLGVPYANFYYGNSYGPYYANLYDPVPFNYYDPNPQKRSRTRK
jgi:hypothetical protein